MLQTATIKFLVDLGKHNDRSWMEANRSRYEHAKADFEQMVSELIPLIAVFDPPIGLLQVKECTFRLNRDVRFSKDKSPYKTNMAAVFNPGGKKMPTPGYYVHVEPGKSFLGGGLWMPEAADLAKLRQEIDYNLDDWKKIVGSKSFRKAFPSGLEKDNSLQRPPKGYEPSNPAIEYLKLKSFTVGTPFAEKELTSPGATKKILAYFREMKPMLDFLNHAIQ